MCPVFFTGDRALNQKSCSCGAYSLFGETHMFDRQFIQFVISSTKEKCKLL